MPDFKYGDVAKMIDHALLGPTLTCEELAAGCQLALAYNVASVCTMPFYLQRCAALLEDSQVKPSTTIGFPHGVHTTSTKRVEAEQALADGCEELDMVVNISKVLTGDWEYVRSDIQAVIGTAHAAGRKAKVIFENCYLNEYQKIRLCEICGELNADWVKTSTGYGTGGATLADVRLMRGRTPAHVQVKAAGGIRDLATVLEFRSLGASRVGASRSKEILDDCRRRLRLDPLDVDSQN